MNAYYIGNCVRVDMFTQPIKTDRFTICVRCQIQQTVCPTSQNRSDTLRVRSARGTDVANRVRQFVRVTIATDRELSRST